MGPSRCVRELMTTDVKVLRRNDRLSIADDLMQQGRIRHLPVLDDAGETVVGIVSQRDLFRSALARALGYGEHAQQKLLDALAVKEVMTNDPVTILPDAAARDAARLMIERKVGCLPVIERGRLVGILSETDLLEAFAAPS